MSKERDSIVRLTTAHQVVNSSFFNEVCNASPFVASIMFDKFKEFLNDDYFTDIERQAILIKFFEGQDNIELIRDILESCKSSRLFKDYNKIILEWTYKYSESLLENMLEDYDSKDLLSNKGLFLKEVPDKINLNDGDFLEKLLEENKQILYGEGE